jgi:7,8-dihydropterin-6-yl-methyl-4-(beta-D-ribofuranosyl)aminobenzene 5'-phosphate synthase
MLSALRVITEAKLTAGLLTLPSSSSLVPLSAPTTIIDLHPARPNYRGFVTPLGIVSLEADPTFTEIEAAGGTVEKHAEAHEVLDSYFLISGEIPRVTEYEKGVRAGLRFEDGAWITDELILDERFVVCHVKGSFAPVPLTVCWT